MAMEAEFDAWFEASPYNHPTYKFFKPDILKIFLQAYMLGYGEAMVDSGKIINEVCSNAVDK